MYFIFVMKITTQQNLRTNFNTNTFGAASFADRGSAENQKPQSDIQTANSSLPSFGETVESRTFVDTKKFQKYKQAQQYVEKRLSECQFDPEILDINDFDIDKLEGLQYGIKVFDGLSMRQIALLYNYGLAMCVSRGCSNGCIHCFVDAKPVHIAKDDKVNIKQMSWEDFSAFTEGIKELNSRMHCKNKGGFINDTVAPFWDADCMEIVMKDKNGKEHDITDISEKIIKDMNKYLLFDTSGWTPKDKKMQARAQKYVDYFKNHELKSNDSNINISLNPFHKLNSKYVEYIESDPKRAKKFRELYVERMANAFYTFTPILNRVDVIDRVMSDESMSPRYYRNTANELLISEIRNRLSEKYQNDSSMSDDDIRLALRRFDYMNSFSVQSILPAGRGESLFSPFDYQYKTSAFIHRKNQEHPEKILKNAESVAGSIFLIDSNGKVYVTNHFNTVPTDIQLNFENKNKQTPPFSGFINRVVTTDELYNDMKS